jgi:branched-subunit amino acid ABC-type transport system permease component
MADFLTVSFNGLTIGAVYALMGLGIVLTMRVTRVANLAQGEFYVVGALLLTTLMAAGLPVGVAVVISVLTGAALGGIQEFGVLRRMRGASSPVLLLSTVAVALVLQGIAVLTWGRDPRTISPYLPGVLEVGGVRMSWQGIALVAAAVVVAGALVYYLDVSRPGKAMAAVAEDPDGARVTGIDVNRIRLVGLVVAGGIGAFAGAIAIGLVLVDFTLGLGLALRGFVAAVAGRMSVVGTLVAGLVLGVAESVVVRYGSSLFRDVIVFGVLVAVVLLLPRLQQQRMRKVAQ